MGYYTKRQEEIIQNLQKQHYKDADRTERDKKLERFNRIWNRDRKYREHRENRKLLNHNQPKT
jgi:hypothetical protein